MRPTFATAALCVLAASQALASDYDGSKPLLCANLEAAYCSAGQPCMGGRADDIGAPTFFRIDFANSSIVGPNRKTPISNLEKSGGQLLLQGTELDHAWNLALDTLRGSIAGTITDREAVVVLFGSCTTP